MVKIAVNNLWIDAGKLSIIEKNSKKMNKFDEIQWIFVKMDYLIDR